MPTIESICKFNRKRCDFCVSRLWASLFKAYQPSVSLRKGMVSLRWACNDA